jgi:hypothetical protein
MPETKTYPPSAEEIRERNRPDEYDQRNREAARQADQQVSEICTIIFDVLNDPRANELLASGTDLVLWTRTSVVGWEDVRRTDSVVITPDKIIHLNREAYRMMPDGSLMGINIDPDAPTGWNAHANKPLGTSPELRRNLYSLKPEDVRRRIEYQLNPEIVTADQKKLNGKLEVVRQLNQDILDLRININNESHFRVRVKRGEALQLQVDQTVALIDQTIQDFQTNQTELVALAEKVIEDVRQHPEYLDIIKYNHEVGTAWEIAGRVVGLKNQVTELENKLKSLREPEPAREPLPINQDAAKNVAETGRLVPQKPNDAPGQSSTRLRDIPGKLLSRITNRFSFLSRNRS